MLKDEMLELLNSDEKYTDWEVLEKFAKDNNLEIKYQNKYVSWLCSLNFDMDKDFSIMIECQNVYGCQMILKFK